MKAYLPNNGTEGEMFINYWCSGCRKEKRCKHWRIGLRGGQPESWFDGDDGPVCIDFIKYGTPYKKKESKTLNLNLWSKL